MNKPTNCKVCGKARLGGPHHVGEYCTCKPVDVEGIPELQRTLRSEAAIHHGYVGRTDDETLTALLSAYDEQAAEITRLTASQETVNDLLRDNEHFIATNKAQAAEITRLTAIEKASIEFEENAACMCEHRLPCNCGYDAWWAALKQESSNE